MCLTAPESISYLFTCLFIIIVTKVYYWWSPSLQLWTEWILRLIPNVSKRGRDQNLRDMFIRKCVLAMLLPVSFSFSPSFLLPIGLSELQFLAIIIFNYFFLLLLLINLRWKICPSSPIWLQQPVSRVLHVYSIHATDISGCFVFASVRPCTWQRENCSGTFICLIGARFQLCFLTAYISMSF